MEDVIFNTNEAAAYLRVSAAVVRLWRTQGRGATYFRAGRLIRYRKSELDRWIARQSREPWQGEDDDTKKPN